MMGALAVLAAYIIGSIPFGLIVVKLMTGGDVREAGSGNIGATNVLRTTGLKAGILTLILDAAKAWFAVWLADKLSGGSELWMSLAALAVLLGHVYSIWLRFKGGKAVASFLGCICLSHPGPGARRSSVIYFHRRVDALFVARLGNRCGSVSGRLLDDPPSGLAGAARGGGRGGVDHRTARRQHHPNTRGPGAGISVPPKARKPVIPPILAIIGGGSWGTALACVQASHFDQVRLWVNEVRPRRIHAENAGQRCLPPGHLDSP